MIGSTTEEYNTEELRSRSFDRCRRKKSVWT